MNAYDFIPSFCSGRRQRVPQRPLLGYLRNYDRLATLTKCPLPIPLPRLERGVALTQLEFPTVDGSVAGAALPAETAAVFEGERQQIWR
jgi:hypothetical protein